MNPSGKQKHHFCRKFTRLLSMLESCALLICTLHAKYLNSTLKHVRSLWMLYNGWCFVQKLFFWEYDCAIKWFQSSKRHPKQHLVPTKIFTFTFCGVLRPALQPSVTLATVRCLINQPQKQKKPLLNKK